MSKRKPPSVMADTYRSPDSKNWNRGETEKQKSTDKSPGIYNPENYEKPEKLRKVSLRKENIAESKSLSGMLYSQKRAASLTFPSLDWNEGDKNEVMLFNESPRKCNEKHNTEKLGQEVSLKEEQVQQNKKEIKELKMQLRDSKKEKKAEIERYNSKIEQLENDGKQEVSRKEPQVHQNNEEIEKLKMELKASEEKFEEKFKRYNSKIEDLEKDNKRLEGEIKNIKIRLGQMEARVEHLESQLEEVKGEKEHLDSQLEEVKGEKESIKLAAMCDQLQKNFYQLVFCNHNFETIWQKSFKVTDIEKDMMKGRYSLKTPVEVNQARKRWKKLKKDIGWDDENDLRGIKMLKLHRLSIAHPEITKDMKEELETDAEVLKEVKQLENFELDIFKKLIQMMSKSFDFVEEQKKKKEEEKRRV